MVLFSIPSQIVGWGLECEAKRHLLVVQIEYPPRYDDVGYLCYEIGSNVLYMVRKEPSSVDDLTFPRALG